MKERAPTKEPRRARGPRRPDPRPGAPAAKNAPRPRRHGEPARSPEKPRDAKRGEARDAKRTDSREAKRGEARDAKRTDSREAKRGEARDANAKRGEARDAKRTDSREAKRGGPRDAKGTDAKRGEARDAKRTDSREAKRGGPRDAKGTDAKRGEPREARRTEAKGAEAKRGEARDAKRTDSREARRAESKPVPAPPTGPRKSGAIALIGRANVGKSTLLNAALGHALAITSPTPQTTRDTLLGVVHRGAAELRLLDTPGLHKPKSELGRVMNHFAREAARAADVIVFVTDLPSRGRPAGAPLSPHPGDLTLLQSFKDGASDPASPAVSARPVVLVINKIDLARDKRHLLPLIEAFSKILPFAAILPLSARRDGDAERLLDAIADLCPEGEWQFGEDDMTDRPTRYFAAEYVREQILRTTRLEVPHAAAVTIERFVEPEIGPVEIDVLIHVERPGQKKILIGKGGDTMKRIGTAARLRVKELLGRKVILRTWVRVTPAWRTSAERLAEMGYQKKTPDEAATFLLELPDLDLETPHLAAEMGPDDAAEPDLEGGADLDDEDQEQ